VASNSGQLQRRRLLRSFLTHLIEGVGTLVGVASGLILGALITYYLLKDGTRLRRAVVAQVRPRLRGEFDSFLGEAFQILRDYGRGRTSCLPLWRW